MQTNKQSISLVCSVELRKTAKLVSLWRFFYSFWTLCSSLLLTVRTLHEDLVKTSQSTSSVCRILQQWEAAQEQLKPELKPAQNLVVLRSSCSYTVGYSVVWCQL